jgi:hypothetical protein
MVIHGFLLNLQIIHFAINLLHDHTDCQLICEVSVSRQLRLCCSNIAGPKSG